MLDRVEPRSIAIGNLRTFRLHLTLRPAHGITLFRLRVGCVAKTHHHAKRSPAAMGIFYYFGACSLIRKHYLVHVGAEFGATLATVASARKITNRAVRIAPAFRANKPNPPTLARGVAALIRRE